MPEDLTTAEPPPSTGRAYSIAELAAQAGVPEAVVEALHREGLLAARDTPDGPAFSTRDAAAVSAGVALLDAGVPLDELLDLARRWDVQARALAGEAVELFLRFVRDPIHGSAASEQEAAERLRMAFDEIFPAAGHIVAHHFQGLLLTAAAARIRSDGDADELAALAGVTAGPDARVDGPQPGGAVGADDGRDTARGSTTPHRRQAPAASDAPA